MVLVFFYPDVKELTTAEADISTTKKEDALKIYFVRNNHEFVRKPDWN